VFDGVDNVVSFKGNDGWIRYMTGSFDNYSDAVNYRKQMRSRGFEDAFIVTFKDGKRIPLNRAITTNKEKTVKTTSKTKQKKVVQQTNETGLKFIVQIGVFPKVLSANDLSMMSKINNVSNKLSGSFYKYFCEFDDYSLAASKLQKVKAVGFNDAFILSKLNGEEISIEKALELDK
jgi:cell division protein FtsN